MRTALHASELDGKTLLFWLFFSRQKSGVIALSFPFSQQEMDGLPFPSEQKDRQTDRDKTLMIGGMRNVSVVFLPRRYLQVLYMGRTVPLLLLLLLLLLLSPND